MSHMSFTKASSVTEVSLLNRRSSDQGGIAPSVLQKHPPPPRRLMARTTAKAKMDATKPGKAPSPTSHRRKPPPVPGNFAEEVGGSRFHRTTKARRSSLTSNETLPRADVVFRDQMRSTVKDAPHGQRKQWGGGRLDGQGGGGQKKLQSGQSMRGKVSETVFLVT